MERAFHEVANIFPLMSGEEFDALVADIDQNGLIEPIWLHPDDDSIIDGRNRYLACQRLGFEPEFRTWNGIGSLTEFVLSLNLHRRHLTGEQRAAIAVDVLPMLEAEAALNVGGRPSKPAEKIPQVNGRAPMSTERAAEMMNTNHRYVSDAKRIAEQAPEVFELMKQAKINMPAAKQLAAMDSAKRIAVLDEMNANGVDRITGREMKTSQLLAQPWPNKPSDDAAWKSNDYTGGYWESINGQKQCAKDPSHVWMADIEYCPYCHASPELRVYLAGKSRNDEKEGRTLPLTAANHAPSTDPDYDGDEWYTPEKYIDAAREVMNGIDLDPASSDEAQRVVQANHYYTKEDNSLDDSTKWYGRIWLNPPYSMPLIQQFVDRVVQEYDAGEVEAAIVLTNNSSDTKWFQKMLERFPACFTRGRVQFWRGDSNTFGARQGQAIFYLGDNPRKFAEIFSELGTVVEAVR